MADVIVVGAGLSGLSAAVRLMAGGLDVTVLEAMDEPGGNVRTLSEDGFTMERGPHTFMASADGVFEFVAESGSAGSVVGARETSEVRFIARAGRLHRVFTGPVSFVTSDLLSWRGKLDLVTEPLRTRRGDLTDTAERFFERRFGPEAARVMAGAFVSGVYAGDPATLSAPAAFPLFWKFEEEHGGMIRGGIALMKQRRRERRALGDAAPPRRKGLFAARGGLGAITASAAAVLGSRLRCGQGVDVLERRDGGWVVRTGEHGLEARHVVVAVPPRAAATLMETVDPELADELSEVRLAPVAVVHMGFSRGAQAVPDGFGFLVPRGEGIRTLGVLFPSRMFDDRAPRGGDLLTGYVGGMLDAGALELEDDQLADVVLADLRTLTGLTDAPDVVKVLRYGAAIPQLETGHLGRMVRVGQRLQGLPGLVLAGNYLRGVGMKDAVASGFDAARRIFEERNHP